MLHNIIEEKHWVLLEHHTQLQPDHTYLYLVNSLFAERHFKIIYNLKRQAPVNQTKTFSYSRFQ